MLCIVLRGLVVNLSEKVLHTTTLQAGRGYHDAHKHGIRYATMFYDDNGARRAVARKATFEQTAVLADLDVQLQGPESKICHVMTACLHADNAACNTIMALQKPHCPHSPAAA